MILDALPGGVGSKWRLFRAGAGWHDKLMLLKFSLRHHMGRFGWRWDWSDREITIHLRSGRSRWTLHCHDSLSHLAVVLEIFGDEQYRPPQEVQRVKTVVDLGANIGIFAAYAGLRFPEARLVCVEADCSNFALLSRNLQQNAPASSAVCRAVVGAGVSGPVSFYRAASAASHSLHAPEAGESEHVEVDSITLDRLLEGVEQIDLLKCDIEGAEAQVLGTMPEEIARRIKWIVLEYHSPGIKRDLLEALHKNFALHRHTAIDATYGLMWLRNKSLAPSSVA